MPSQDDDGLDASAWERLSAAVRAADSGDRAAFKGEFERWASDSPVGEQQRIGLYLFAAVKYMVKVLLQGEPSDLDLNKIAARCFPYVERVLAAHPQAVEDALRAIFGMPFIRRKLRPGERLVLNAAIAGWMLDQLGAELPAIRQWVAEWWKVNAHSAREAGVKFD